MEKGAKLGHYQILSAIGAGGMGEVFLANDTKLDRKVALKILPSEFAEDSDRMSRFVREAKSASALNHPNIITIYEIGEAEGTHFIAAEFIDGKTLSEYAKANPLDFKTVLDIATQIASALQIAHSAGIVHRDIKPDNVMIRADGLAKILDFGIAKLSEPTAIADGLNLSEDDATVIKPNSTSPGMIIGTASYMSPEQACGKVVDSRSDIFSFGVVLYEMISGGLPFEGETAMERIGAILHKEPKPLDKAEISPEIEKITGKCLRKDKTERYQTIKDVCNDLKQMQTKLLVEAELERAAPAPNRKEAETQILQVQTTAETKTRNSIAVLPFTNMSADAENEYFCDGLAEELLNALAKIDDLKVAARTSAFSFKNKNVETGEIGKTLNVKTVLEGSVRKSGTRLRITVQLINAADGYHLWSERYDREMQDIFDVQDEITLAVVDALKVKLFGDEKAAVLRRYTDNTEAYELYLKGRYHYHKYTPEGWLKAIEFFEQAVAKEPNYAPAYANLASVFSFSWFFSVLPPDETAAKWKAATLRALELDARSDEAHSALARWRFYYEWNWSEAEREFLRAIELNPDNAEIHHQYGIFLAAMGRFDEAAGEGAKALELDPLSLLVNLQVGWVYVFSGHLDEAFELTRKMLEMEPNFHGAYWQTGTIQGARGQLQEAVESYRKAASLGSYQVVLSTAGSLYARLGKRNEALELLNQLLEMRKRQPVSAFNIARVYGGLGETDKVFEWLEKAVEERNGELVFLNVKSSAGYMFTADIRQEARFQNVLRRIGLPIDEAEQTGESLEAKTVMLTSETPAAAGGLTQTAQEANKKITTSNANLQPSAAAEVADISDKRKPKWRLLSLLALIILGGGFFGYKYFAPTKHIESIAVMPFVNESGNADVEYLSDGMSETLIKSLSQLPNLNVKPRSSVFRYKGKDTDLQTIGKELNVQAILTGRVIQRGEQLTLSLELVDVSKDSVIWTEQYQRKTSELVSLQSEISKDVSTKLKSKLSGAETAKVEKKYTENPEAYQLYLKGRYQWNKRTGDALKQAVEYFNQAIEKDPNYALAYSGLAESYTLFGIYSVAPPRDAMPKAKAAALRAVELDDSLAETRVALGIYYSNFAWNQPAAEREFRRAIELNPNYATAHQQFGVECLTAMSRFDEAVAEGKRAEELDPLSPIIGADLGMVLFRARRFDEAIAQLNRVIALDPNFWVTYWYLGMAYHSKGQYREAVAAYRKGMALSRSEWIKAVLIQSLVKTGERDEAVKLLNELQAEAARRYVSGSALALAYGSLGEKDKAFAYLNKDVDERASRPSVFSVNPVWDDLRDDPRFAEVVRRIEAAKMD